MDVGTTVAGVGSTRSVADVVAVVVVDSLRRSLHRKVFHPLLYLSSSIICLTFNLFLVISRVNLVLVVEVLVMEDHHPPNMAPAPVHLNTSLIMPPGPVILPVPGNHC
jgi:hypothetical protein